MSIKSLTFKEDYELSLEKKSQKRWGVKTHKPTVYTREKRPWKTFTLFKKGLHIDFQEGINVIVGENGSGKSTLLRLIESYVGKAPDKLTMAFGNYKDEEDYIEKHRKTYRGELKIDGDLSFKNTIFFDAEKDNPVVCIPKMMTPSNMPAMAAQLFDAQEESHGESMQPVLEYILENAVNCTIFMDEPDTALSLKNQMWLTKTLIKSAKVNHNQIIISTHALAIINRFERIFDMETRTWVDRETYVKEIMK